MAGRGVDDRIRLGCPLWCSGEETHDPAIPLTGPSGELCLDGDVLSAPPELGWAGGIKCRRRQDFFVRNRRDARRCAAFESPVEPSSDLDQERVSLNPLLDGSVDDTVRPPTGPHGGAAIEKDVEPERPVAVHDPGEGHPERVATERRRTAQTVLHRVAAEDAVGKTAIAFFEPDHRLDECFGLRIFLRAEPARRRQPDCRLAQVRAAMRMIPQESMCAFGEPKIISDVYMGMLALPYRGSGDDSSPRGRALTM